MTLREAEELERFRLTMADHVGCGSGLVQRITGKSNSPSVKRLIQQCKEQARTCSESPCAESSIKYIVLKEGTSEIYQITMTTST